MSCFSLSSNYSNSEWKLNMGIFNSITKIEVFICIKIFKNKGCSKSSLLDKWNPFCATNDNNKISTIINKACMLARSVMSALRILDQLFTKYVHKNRNILEFYDYNLNTKILFHFILSVILSKNDCYINRIWPVGGGSQRPP